MGPGHGDALRRIILRADKAVVLRPLEPQHPHAEHPPFGDRMGEAGRGGAKVLGNHQCAREMRLQGDQPDEIGKGIGQVSAFGRGAAGRHHPQPGEAEGVVDPEASVAPEGIAQHGDERGIAASAQAVG